MCVCVCVCVSGMVRERECAVQLTGLSEKQGAGPCSCSCPLSVRSLMGEKDGVHFGAHTHTLTHKHTQRLVLRSVVPTLLERPLRDTLHAWGGCVCEVVYCNALYIVLVLQHQKSCCFINGSCTLVCSRAVGSTTVKLICF